MIEQIIFTFIAFAIFVYMFILMMKKNDVCYIVVLVLEAIGIAINIIQVLFKVELNALLIILKYIFAIIIPLVIIIEEFKGKHFPEVANIARAKIYLKFGNNKKAKQILLDMASEYPENYNAHKLLAEIYEQEGGMRKAVDEYVQAVDLNKQDYHSYFKIAYLLTNLDKKQESIEMLNSLLSKKPDYIEASNLLGELLIENQSYKEAANVLQDALRYNPISFDLNYNLGIVYTMLNDFQNAKICYEKAAEINSLSYNSKYSLAEIALIYKELEEAEQKFLEAIEDEELAPDGYYELSKIYLIKGDKDTAIKYANIAIDLGNRKIVDKIKKESIFIPILAKISIPFNLDMPEEKKETKQTEKEIKAKEHLEEMFEITRHLSYNDIGLLRKGNSNSGERKETIEKIQPENEKIK